MTKRAKLIAALAVAFGLVVLTPLAAYAYWAVTAQLAVTAQASTFSVAAFTVTPASSASATSFVGWSTTQYYAAPLTNNGKAPWASQSVSVAASSGFGSAAAATLQVAFTPTSGICQTDSTYAGVTAQSALGSSSWSSTTAVAAGGTLYACVKLVVTDTDTHTASGAAAPTPALTLTSTATVKQQNWTDQEAATLAVSSTGWAACTNSGSNVKLTLASALPSGTYTIVRNDTGATFTGSISASAPTSLTLSNPATSGTETATTHVMVKNSAGTAVAAATLTFASSGWWIFWTDSLACA